MVGFRSNNTEYIVIGGVATVHLRRLDLVTMEEKMGMFEGRHYQAIAEELDTCHEYMEGPYVELSLDMKWVAERFADLFEKDNPNFEKESFLKDCGMEEG